MANNIRAYNFYNYHHLEEIIRPIVDDSYDQMRYLLIFQLLRIISNNNCNTEIVIRFAHQSQNMTQRVGLLQCI